MAKALDDIIRNSKKSRGFSGNPRGRGRGFGSRPGPARRFPNRPSTRATPYLNHEFVEVVCRASGKTRRFSSGTEANFAVSLINRKVQGGPIASHIEAVKEGEEPVSFGPNSVLVDYGDGWKLQTVTEGAGPRKGEFNQPRTLDNASIAQVQQMLAIGAFGAESGTKLYISNLDYGVSHEDIKVLFSDVGPLKRHSIHYDQSGRSKGTAEVVFAHHSDALKSIERFNNVHLDRKPMKIELVGVKIVAHAAVLPINNGILGNNPSAGFIKYGFSGLF